MGVRFLSVLETLLQMQLICEKWMLCYVFNYEVLFLVMMKHRIQRFMCIFELVCTKKDKVRENQILLKFWFFYR